MTRFIMALIAAVLAGPIVAEAQLGAGLAACDLETVLEELPTQRLRKKEKRDLLFMREEEKLARDVYLTLYEEWGLRIFAQIARSERDHMASALVLVEKYELRDPVGANPLGVFENQGLQALYEELSSAGLASLENALLVGVAVEELDIYDLGRAYDKTNNKDLKVLYQNLMKGSRNHLRAFASVLERSGGSYTPVNLTPEEYQAIVESPRETGLVGTDGEPLCG